MKQLVRRSLKGLLTFQFIMCVPLSTAMANNSEYPENFVYEPEIICQSENPDQYPNYTLSSYYFENERFEDRQYLIVIQERFQLNGETRMRQSFRTAVDEQPDTGELIRRFVDGVLIVNEVSSNEQLGAQLRIGEQTTPLRCSTMNDALPGVTIRN